MVCRLWSSLHYRACCGSVFEQSSRPAMPLHWPPDIIVQLPVNKRRFTTPGCLRPIELSASATDMHSTGHHAALQSKVKLR